jgi:hypothetical protein
VGGSGPDRRGDDAPGGATAGATAGDRVAAAVEELYGADPEAFTGRRGELVTAARTAGDRAAAKAIAALRRPTRAAWVVNRLARTDPGAPPRLTELATALRAAQEARDGPRLRELSAERGALVDALTAQALAAAGVADPPASLRLEVGETLQAALADPEVAAAFATGTLTRAAQWSGFGLPLAGAAPDRDEETREAPPAAKRPEAAARNAGRARDAGRSSTAGPAAGRRPAAGAGAGADRAAAAAAAARRQAEEDERLARAAAERAARRREQIEDAERAVVAAATAATEASSAEDRLEAAVRDLEQRLTRARTDLAAARMRARHAEAAERRARQAMDRLARE